ncbi:MAG: hypothetical protein JWN76_1183 [Chitinophagaceae bacterium]|nr:hypothetical protein [Chitinophagaceae bacterium]
MIARILVQDKMGQPGIELLLLSQFILDFEWHFFSRDILDLTDRFSFTRKVLGGKIKF